jgi:hypothetical protein
MRSKRTITPQHFSVNSHRCKSSKNERKKRMRDRDWLKTDLTGWRKEKRRKMRMLEGLLRNFEGSMSLAQVRQLDDLISRNCLQHLMLQVDTLIFIDIESAS